MDTQAFQHLLSLIPRLTLRQGRLAQHELTMPHHFACHSTASLPLLPPLSGRGYPIGPHGWNRGLRRYRCKLCQRTSSVLTNTPMARLRKAQCWVDYAQALIDGLTVRKAALRKTPPSCGVTAS